jgi:hypothetical protein
MDFEQINADRVFHALLCLSLVREKEHNLDELLKHIEKNNYFCYF